MISFFPTLGKWLSLYRKKNYPSISSIVAMAPINFFPLDIYAVATVLEGRYQNGQVQNEFHQDLC